MEIAYFAAGCFWGVEEAFRKMDGVTDTAVGYMGGHTENPTYKQVSSGKTGHAETTRVGYDPEQVSYEELLDRFWSIHDPTQVDRQGPDVGSQYRSAIFYTTEEQKKSAERSKEELQKKLDKPVASQIIEAPEFWRAEDYHQRYFEKRGGGTCHI